ncbi:MAG: GDP-L-fucose synthase [Pseudomonadota bacterium]
MSEAQRIFVAGHRGLVGSAIVRRLAAMGRETVLVRARSALDLTDAAAVNAFFASEKPTHVVLAAAKVGGIKANDTYPAEFLRDNLAIQTNVIHAAWAHGVAKLVFLGSSCIYPRLAPQPMQEEYLLTGALEPTNEWYAIAKIAGIKMCQAYRRQYGFNAISLMPTNLYGPGDNFSIASSHVLPALIRRFHEAKLQNSPEIVIWGTGTPKREFLHVDDVAAATVFLMDHYDGEGIVNVGTGSDVTIAELAQTIGEVVGYTGAIGFDPTKPDGTPRKWLDVSKATELGWTASIGLREGIASTYQWFREHTTRVRREA